MSRRYTAIAAAGDLVAACGDGTYRGQGAVIFRASTLEVLHEAWDETPYTGSGVGFQGCKVRLGPALSWADGLTA